MSDFLQAMGGIFLILIWIGLIVAVGVWWDMKWQAIKEYRSAKSLQEACDRLSEENVALKAKVTLLESQGPYGRTS